MIIFAACLFAGAFLTSATLTAVARKISVRLNFVARPSADRYHTSIIPLGGGIAIFVTVALFVLGGAAVIKLFASSGCFGRLDESVSVYVDGFLKKIPALIVVMAACFVLHLMGLWDDKKHLGPSVKLFFQFLVAFTVAVFADVRVEFFIQNRFITATLSVVWIVLIINVFNFLDNMDGLSAGLAAITTSVLFVAAVLSGQVFVGSLGLVFAGALFGFLIFNFPPAKIFMGDAGSLVVGFFVALLTLRTTYYRQAEGGGLYAVFMPLVVMAVPLYDFISVTFLRIRQGKSPFIGDTQHFSHRLKRRGLTDTQTCLTLYLATLCTSISAIFLWQVNLTGAVLIFAQTVMILAIIAILESTAYGKTG